MMRSIVCGWCTVLTHCVLSTPAKIRVGVNRRKNFSNYKLSGTLSSWTVPELQFNGCFPLVEYYTNAFLLVSYPLTRANGSPFAYTGCYHITPPPLWIEAGRGLFSRASSIILETAYFSLQKRPAAVIWTQRSLASPNFRSYPLCYLGKRTWFTYHRMMPCNRYPLHVLPGREKRSPFA